MATKPLRWIPLFEEKKLLIRAVVTVAVTSFLLLVCLGIIDRKWEFWHEVVAEAWQDVNYAFNGGILAPVFGLLVLLVLDFIAKWLPALQIDWTLIRWWGKQNPIAQVLLGPVLGLWWGLSSLIILYTSCFGVFFIGILVIILIGVLSWFGNLLTTIINRVFIIIPYIASKEDAEKVKEFGKDLFQRLKSWWKKGRP